MKFVISLLFLTHSLKALALTPINIFYEGTKEEVLTFKKIMTDEYLIPEELMELHPTKNCNLAESLGKLDLCLKENGDLHMVSVDKQFITKSLKIFWDR